MIHVKEIEGKGRGVVATADIENGRFIVGSKVVAFIDKDDPLRDYAYPWDDEKYALCVGPIAGFNHSYTPNCYWVLDDRDPAWVKVFAAKDIRVGAELTIPYNCKLWFDPK